MSDRPSAPIRARISSLIEKTLGLHFPPNRWPDLERGLRAVARDVGVTQADEVSDWVLSTPLSPRHVELLARHLTISETYFFRHLEYFEFLEQRILPELIRLRRAAQRPVRVWSAGCSSGEEAYSLAILLRQLLPDHRNGEISLLATDISLEALQRARVAEYGEWSFRELPAWMRARYFTPTSDGRFRLNPEIQSMVRFAQLNLVEDGYPSPANDTHELDLILCRNVLIYFAPATIDAILQRFHRALSPEGWLIVGPSETTMVMRTHFTATSAPRLTLFQAVRPPQLPAREANRSARASDTPVEHATAPMPRVKILPAIPVATPTARAIPVDQHIPVAGHADGTPTPATDDRLLAMLRDGRSAQVIEMLATEEGVSSTRANGRRCLHLARAYANVGQQHDALRWIAQAITVEKTQPVYYYVAATIHLELGQPAAAATALRRALYLKPDFIMAHFTLGNLAGTQGHAKEMQRHFRNALRLLEQLAPDEIVAESDGLTTGRFAALVSSLMTVEKRL